jgi:hypothetical protein
LDGASFDWKWFHEGGPGGAFLDPEGEPLIRLQAPAGWAPNSAIELEQCDVKLTPALSTHLRSALLAAFGWYLILFDQMKERDAVVAETTLRL